LASEIEVRVPDIGDFEKVEVVEVLVAPGDRVEEEDSLVSLESDKATMEIPAPRAGIVRKLEVAVGDAVSMGSVLLTMEVEESVAADLPPRIGEEESAAEQGAEEAAPRAVTPSIEAIWAKTHTHGPEHPPAPWDSAAAAAGRAPHASPLVRKAARELGVDLSKAEGSGPNERILVDDVKRHVRGVMAAERPMAVAIPGADEVGAPAVAPGAGSSAPGAGSRAPGAGSRKAIDFSRFGEIEERALGKIRRVSAANLSRSWQTVPHVTQQDEADVTDLESFRRRAGDAAKERGVKLSPLHFLMKATAVALREFPDFRSSLAPDGQSLILKNYYHLGIAVDTEQGLVVPVVRDVDQKGILEIAGELAGLAERARARKLRPEEMQGACFTISSLGGIGGTHFTPIVNAPEVAILGASALQTKPLWQKGPDGEGEEAGCFVPRKVLPLSLSYDHRVIDGAEAVRFTTRLKGILERPVNLLL